MAKKIERLVPDTSVLIQGLLSEQISKKELVVKEIIIHEAVIAELEHQTNQGKAIGYLGLDEIKALKKIFKNNLKFVGRRPRSSEIRYASLGEIDSLIRDMAWEQDATLITADNVQARIAEAKGIKFILIPPKEKIIKKLKLEKFFDAETMSVHLREGVVPYAKRGMPGRWQFKALRKKPLTQEEIKEVSKDIIEQTKMRRDGFVEIQKEASTIVQLGHFRIVITKPPFSDGWEITAVKPIKKLDLKDYRLSEKLHNRIAFQAEGILVAGAPGMGKSTFSAALAKFYALQNKIVKTIEAPRDLILPENITQYAISHADTEEIHDILLLSRPDHTIFDEMRNTSDFKLFADLRLSGIGLAGVVHATNPIDAIQRFVGRIELGVIPHVIDTVIFIKNGQVDKVLSVNMTVKVPSGMIEADLARPVVQVKDFETGKEEYELYSYGEETVLIEVRKHETSPINKLAERQIEKIFYKMVDRAKAEITGKNKAIVYIPKEDMARIIGKQGKTIEALEQKLGVHIELQELDLDGKKQKKINFEFSERGDVIYFYVEEMNIPIDFFINDQFLFTATSSKKGEIRVNKQSKLGRTVEDAIRKKKKIELRLGGY